STSALVLLLVADYVGLTDAKTSVPKCSRSCKHSKRKTQLSCPREPKVVSTLTNCLIQPWTVAAGWKQAAKPTGPSCGACWTSLIIKKPLMVNASCISVTTSSGTYRSTPIWQLLLIMVNHVFRTRTMNLQPSMTTGWVTRMLRVVLLGMTTEKGEVAHALHSSQSNQTLGRWVWT